MSGVCVHVCVILVFECVCDCMCVIVVFECVVCVQYKLTEVKNVHITVDMHNLSLLPISLHLHRTGIIIRKR